MENWSVFSIPIFHDLYKYVLIPPTDVLPIEGALPKEAAFKEGDMVIIRLYKEVRNGQDNIMMGDGRFFKEDPEPVDGDIDANYAYKRKVESLKKRAKTFVRKITMIDVNKVVKHKGRVVVPYLVENGNVFCFDEKGKSVKISMEFFSDYTGPLKDEIIRVVELVKPKEKEKSVEVKDETSADEIPVVKVRTRKPRTAKKEVVVSSEKQVISKTIEEQNEEYNR